MNCLRCDGTGTVYELSRTTYEHLPCACPRCGGKGRSRAFYIERDGLALHFSTSAHTQRITVATPEYATLFDNASAAQGKAEQYGLKEGEFEIKTI